MKIVTRKVRTVTTKKDTFLLGAFINLARFGHIKKSVYSLFPVATPKAERPFKGDALVLGNLCSQLLVLTCQVHWAVKTI